MAKLDRMPEAKDEVPSAEQHRLARFYMGDYRTVKPGQLLNDVDKLKEELPKGSELFAVRYEWSSAMSMFVAWDIMMSCPHALPMVEWEKHYQEMRKLLEMHENQGQGIIEVASPSEKLKLLTWEDELNQIGGYKLSSLEELTRMCNAA
ncbi:hypothetical protein AALT_g11724 [Alternaria alternata]|nr:hypothetical protein AALT_g11724 [Alternaria alternata]